MNSIRMQVVRKVALEVLAGSVDSKRLSRPCLEEVVEVEISTLILEEVRVTIRVSVGSEELEVDSAEVDSNNTRNQMVIMEELMESKGKGLSQRRLIYSPVRTI